MEMRASAAVEPDATTGSVPALVRLVQFPPIWERNVSPFGLKLETWLRLAGIPFEVETSTRLDRAPKGKLPYIVDNGRKIGDSTLIIEHLKTTRGIDPDASLNDKQRAQAVALQRLLEDHLYFIMAYSRWLDPEGAPVVSEAFFAGVPAPLRMLARAYFKRRVVKLLHAQGIGRHSADEIYGLARDDLGALSTVLGDKPFFLGEQLTTLDATAYGFLANILLVPVETELKRITQDFSNLVAWCDTMEAGIYHAGE